MRMILKVPKTAEACKAQVLKKAGACRVQAQQRPALTQVPSYLQAFPAFQALRKLWQALLP